MGTLGRKWGEIFGHLDHGTPLHGLCTGYKAAKIMWSRSYVKEVGWDFCPFGPMEYPCTICDQNFVTIWKVIFETHLSLVYNPFLFQLEKWHSMDHVTFEDGLGWD
jgi:hypothetical protein